MTENLKLRQILLTKLNNLLNPNFSKKYIWALFSLGAVVVSSPIALQWSIVFSFLKHQGIEITLSSVQNIFLFLLGCLFVVFSAVLFYWKDAIPQFQKDVPTNKLKVSTFRVRQALYSKVAELSFCLERGSNDNPNIVTATLTTLARWDFPTGTIGLPILQPVLPPEEPRVLISPNENESTSANLVSSFSDLHSDAVKLNLHTNHIIIGPYDQFEGATLFLLQWGSLH